jgi:hypothetical protein
MNEARAGDKHRLIVTVGGSFQSLGAAVVGRRSNRGSRRRRDFASDAGPVLSFTCRSGGAAHGGITVCCAVATHA